MVPACTVVINVVAIPLTTPLFVSLQFSLFLCHVWSVPHLGSLLLLRIVGPTLWMVVVHPIFGGLNMLVPLVGMTLMMVQF